MTQAKPFPITKRMVWEAWKKVKANQGGAGIDSQTIADFEADLGNNLYKLWNRMASGSYFPSAVRRVDIPKASGGMRPLGIPTVADRIAQMVAKQWLEPEMEKHFHPDSYGYRPGKSAHQALGQTRQRCWRYDWVLDLDIKAFFDTIDHDLLMRALRRHTDQKWVLLYVERWLTAPVAMPDGDIQERDLGTPQGGVISPLLANLFLHYAFDMWMAREFPDIPFARYADDCVCHCQSERQSKYLRYALERRLAECGLTLHPAKTKIVYCQDSGRRGEYSNTSFDFLGYTFCPRRSRNRWGKFFVSFSPAISNKAKKSIRQTVRGWKLHLRSDKSLVDLSRMFDATIRGWISYYGAFYKSALRLVLCCIDRRLVLWATRKYKRLRGHRRKAAAWLRKIQQRYPILFAHWQFFPQAAA